MKVAAVLGSGVSVFSGSGSTDAGQKAEQRWRPGTGSWNFPKELGMISLH